MGAWRGEVWMAGPDPRARGGIASVVQSYQTAGLFRPGEVRYLVTYEGAGLLRQLRCFGRALARLGGALLRQQVAVLHLHSASRGSFWRKTLLAGLARLGGVPYVLHIHSGEWLDHYEQHWSATRRWLARASLQAAGCVLVLTPDWQRAFAAAIAKPVRWDLAPNPVTVPAGLPATPPPLDRLLFLGRLTELKGAFDLVRAMALVHPHHPEARLTMAGPGDVAPMRALMRELGLPAHCIDFPGWIEGADKAAAIATHGCFVLPSHAEGLPIGILEAMAAGLVVVASRVGGIPELIHEGRNGRLVDKGDVAALAASLRQVLSDAEASRRMIEQAFMDVQPHALPVVVNGLRRLYAQLAPAHSATNERS